LVGIEVMSCWVVLGVLFSFFFFLCSLFFVVCLGGRFWRVFEGGVIGRDCFA